MRDHGGDIDMAQARFGGTDWIDLSTGINRAPYPLPPLPDEAWTALPTAAATARLLAAAGLAYRSQAPMLAVAGAQAAIQLIPKLGAPAQARILTPTYNEHGAALRSAGWRADEVTTLTALEGADLAVVVNPNNPDGRSHASQDLLRLASRVGRLVVDESFADAQPDLSLAPHAARGRLLVLRSFGKFYGLAGVRLGFILGSDADIAALAEMAGPWPVSGPAIAIGTAALSDRAWAEATVARLRADAARLDLLAQSAGWKLVGGTELFRLYDTPNAAAAREKLARHQIWTRMFPFSDPWLRLGLPGQPAEWDRLAAALQD
ncbi:MULTISPECIES: threonine-phosphate decarboxylase CobD [Bradyrhizobium]|uniref:threonine-phosphate decarboxylase n=2 Tax=Bradyrhizobium TaxID=374 RepID=A0ABY0P9L3_9BRAD|nr:MULTISPECIES: threonine-phosphate decarboxylase CobD [Bradyrhizobium]SDH77157.1 L-threonine O-3-phosphate decarboxylase [Bradyrhizobium ottawaense]